MYERNLPSLADLAYKHDVDYFVVFVDLDEQHLESRRSSLWRLLKPGFRHVEVWKRIEPTGVWVRFDTAVELVKFEIHVFPPQEVLERLNPTVVRVRRTVPNGTWRERFFMGPITCVELAKAFLGISKFTVRTPWQLYRYLIDEKKQLTKTA